MTDEPRQDEEEHFYLTFDKSRTFMLARHDIFDSRSEGCSADSDDKYNSSSPNSPTQAW